MLLPHTLLQMNPRVQVLQFAASLAAAYESESASVLSFSGPPVHDFEAAHAAAEHPRVQVAGDYFLA